ncbi:MAG TPA: hypothetical protein DCM73_02220 [Clostridiales bacterium]|nr:hypothetical protein [Clostridiales bacterium]
MAKRRISLLLVAFMVLTMAMPLNAYGEVNDYTGHWAESTIQQWLNKGQISGYPDGTFKPDGKVTRAEFVKMVNGAFNYTETSTIEFSDVKSGDWYYQEVQKAFKAGFIAGI